MKKNVQWVVLSLVFCASIVAAQEKTKNEEYIQQAEQYKKSMLMRVLDSGVQFMDEGNF